MKSALRIFVIAIVAVSCAAWLLLSADAQKRRNEFFHNTAAHKKIGCASCHKTPTANSIGVRGFPDVADYPGHSSCVRCHREDFFQGNNPAICTICHTASGPRSGPRFPFPVRSRSSEFTTIFPHSVHQDIIARNEMYRQRLAGCGGSDPLPLCGRVAHTTAAGSAALRADGTVSAHFVNASFSPAASPADDPPPPQFNNCAICHQTLSAMPKFGNRQPMRGQALAGAAIESFTPGAGFFKSSPEGHASCFSCHYQGQKPVSTDCAGCHRPAGAYFESGAIARYSLKFDHRDPNHAISDCTSCHVRITQNSDLAMMKDADVPFLSCSTSSCHGKDLSGEVKKRADSIANKQPLFQCAYCHAPEIGRFEIPASHKPR
jgi:hypothetical protein